MKEALKEGLLAAQKELQQKLPFVRGFRISANLTKVEGRS